MSKGDPWHLQASEVAKQLGADTKHGLTESEAKSLLQKHGKNEIPSPPSQSLITLIIGQFKDLLVLILLGAAVVSFFLALFEDSHNDRLTAFVEPAVILIILIANATVGVIQETNAEAAIEKLKENEARTAQVLRDDVVKEIDASDLVPGDIIIVAVGDKVPADSRLIELESPVLAVDEAPLTGESENASKHVEPIEVKNPVNQDKRNMLFSGTLVTRGKARAVVTQTGSKTEIGRVAQDIDAKNDDKTPLQQKLDRFGEQLSKVIGVICIVVWLINIGHFTDPVHGGFFKGAIYYFKIAVALAVAAIPEGLPAVVTTCLALGTRKMAKKNAIVRSLPSVETLGCTTVICSDKTGTLTTNQMSAERVLIIDNSAGIQFKEFEVSGDSFAPIGVIKRAGVQLRAPAVEEPILSEIGRISSLCSEATLFYQQKDNKSFYSKTGTPTEAALLVLAEKIGVPDRKRHEETDKIPDGNERCRQALKYWAESDQKQNVLEFDRNRKSMSVIVSRNDGKRYLLCKGAPEKVLQRCNFVQGLAAKVALDSKTRNDFSKKLEVYGEEGLRTIAFAWKQWDQKKDVDFTNLDLYPEYESDMVFLGVAALRDPPRAEVPRSISRCKAAGIRVVVITGDLKKTAESICRKIGVFKPDEDIKGKSFEGKEFEAMSLAERKEAVKNASLFSRVEPKHKKELVTLLKEQGEVVAMTGDGVNDASALKKADIGVAMGSGTAVAKEASHMVLQDDNFATIVMAVEEGRAIYANTKQFIRYLISSNIGEVACIFLTAALGMPEALIPVQLLWVNLVTDGLPATALGFNPPDKDIMEHDPRGKDEDIIDRWLFFRYLIVGCYVGFATVGGYIWWSVFYPGGANLTFKQLTSFHECGSGSELFKGFDCKGVFENPKPGTMSLSILVVIEMFNALNALSENQSLLSVGPASNPWVLLACSLSLILHFIVVYVPFFSPIFRVAPLNLEEWIAVLCISFPVLLIDETLKWVSRKRDARGGATGKTQKKKAHLD